MSSDRVSELRKGPVPCGRTNDWCLVAELYSTRAEIITTSTWIIIAIDDGKSLVSISGICDRHMLLRRRLFLYKNLTKLVIDNQDICMRIRDTRLVYSPAFFTFSRHYLEC